MTSVKQCARASYVEIYWFLSISTTDVTTCDATDAFCALVRPQPYGAFTLREQHNSFCFGDTMHWPQEQSAFRTVSLLISQRCDWAYFALLFRQIIASGGFVLSHNTLILSHVISD
jgi:hypothetical protein